MFGTLLVLHLLGAAIWTGGHLVLALTILPRALRTRSIEDLQRFESGYERIGIPALLVQVVTGFLLAQRLVPDHVRWFDPADPVGRLVGLKLSLLGITVLFALDARLRVLPRLTPERLGSLAWHVIPVTIVSVLFVVVGAAFRAGFLY